MLTGSGNREQPLLVVTTTAGDDRSYIWLEEYKFSKQVASGDIEDEKLFSFIFELDEDDDPLDESVWAKANPNLGVSVKADYLRDAAKRAAESVLDMHRFKRYHCNLLVDSHERPISMKDWDACQGELSDWRDADAVGAGVDLGSREDLASFALVARFRTDPGGEDDRPTYRYEARQSSYLSRDTTRNLNEAPWAEWVHNDILHVSHSPLDDLTEHLIEECRKWQVDSVAYDPYAGQLFAESVEAEGILVASMAQNQRHFHEPISDLLSSIQLARFRHDGDPLLRWAIGNVVVVKDRQDRWMFDKKTSHDKIDPAVALVMAFRRCSAAAGKCDGSFFMV
jgi:phage terminase large subunit-like protein